MPSILADAADSPKIESLLEALGEFGLQSGLFEEVRVQGSAVRLRIAGRMRDLADTGRGVRQVLPVLAEALIGPEGSTFLLEQPELFLHPRGQAALGSFLAALARQGKRFVIETHGDALVDRIRLEIREDGLLRPEDVSLLYFEGGGGGTRIHRLALDEYGNVFDLPAGYRAFFLEEERRFLGL